MNDLLVKETGDFNPQLYNNVGAVTGCTSVQSGGKRSRYKRSRRKRSRRKQSRHKSRRFRHKRSRRKQSRHKSRRLRHKRSRRNLKRKNTLRSVAGNRTDRIPRTRAEVRKYNYEKESAKVCVRNIFNILARLAGAKGKVELLMTWIYASADKRPHRMADWKQLLNAGKSYRLPNAEVLKKEIYGTEILEVGSIMQVVNKAEEEIRKDIEGYVDMATNPANFTEIVDKINRLIVEIVWDNTYIHRNETGDIVARPNPNVDYEIRMFMRDYNSSEVPDSLLLSEIRQIYSLKPIRAKMDTTDGFARRLAFIIKKATNQTDPLGVVRIGKYGFVICNAGKMDTLYELTNIYEKQFVELIPFLPSNMFRAVPDGSEDYAYLTDDEYNIMMTNTVRDLRDLYPELYSSSSEVEDAGSTAGSTSSSIVEDAGSTAGSTPS